LGGRTRSHWQDRRATPGAATGNHNSSGWDSVGGYLENRGKDLFRLAKEKGLEGIIAKRKGSAYRPGRRSPDWLKIKARPQQEFVVCGFTEGKGSRFKNFGALLLAGYQDGKLRYFGHSGSGFSEKGLQETMERLRPLFTDKAPVWNPPKIPERIQWVQPKLVCEVAFAEWTQDGELRQTAWAAATRCVLLCRRAGKRIPTLLPCLARI
jgi:bifunctional non-homologous end joining protein LigD